MKTCKEYRMQARDVLRGNYGPAIGALIVFELITTVVTASVVAGIVLTGMFVVGYTWMYMGVVRERTLKFENMFAGFSRNKLGSTIGLFLETGIFVVLWTCLFVVPGIIAGLSYSMAPYILADHPEIRGIDAIKASKAVMKGKKGKLFLLGLSYIGWDLLCVLTLGILGLWVVPWQQAAEASFYEDIKNEVVIPN